MTDNGICPAAKITVEINNKLEFNRNDAYKKYITGLKANGIGISNNGR